MILYQLQAKPIDGDTWEILKESDDLAVIEKAKTEWETVNRSREFHIVQVVKEDAKSETVINYYGPSHYPDPKPPQKSGLIGDGSVFGGCIISFIIFALMFIIRRFKCVPFSAYIIAFLCIIALGAILSIEAGRKGEPTACIIYHAALALAYLMFV